MAPQVGYHPDPVNRTTPTRRPPTRQTQLVLRAVVKGGDSPKPSAIKAPAPHAAPPSPPLDPRPSSPLHEKFLPPPLDPLPSVEIIIQQDEPLVSVRCQPETQEFEVESAVTLPEIAPVERILTSDSLDVSAPTLYTQITPPIMVLQPPELEVFHDFEMGRSSHVDAYEIFEHPDAPTQDAFRDRGMEKLDSSSNSMLQHDELEHNHISASIECVDSVAVADPPVPTDTAVVELMAEVTCEAPMLVLKAQTVVNEVKTRDVFGPRNTWPEPEPSAPPVSQEAAVEPYLAPNLEENVPEEPYLLLEVTSSEPENKAGPTVDHGSVADLLAALSKEAEPTEEVEEATELPDEDKCSKNPTPQDTKPVTDAPLIPATHTPVVVARSTTNSYFVERSVVMIMTQTDHNPSMAPDSHDHDPSTPAAAQKTGAVPETARRCVSTPPSVGDRLMAMVSKEDYSKVASRFKDSKTALSLKGSGPRGVSLLSWDKNGRSTGGSTSVYWPLNSPAVDPQSDGFSSLTFADLGGASELDVETPQRLTGHASCSSHLGGAGMPSRSSTAGRNSRLPLRPLSWMPDKGADSAEAVSAVVPMPYSDSSHADGRMLEASEAQMFEAHHRKDSWSGNASIAFEQYERRTGGSSAHMMLPSSPDLLKSRAYTPSSLVGLPLIRRGRHSTSSPAVGLAITEAMAKKTTAAAIAPLCVAPIHVMQTRDLPYMYAPQNGVVSDSATHDTLKQDSMIWGIEEGAQVSDSLSDWWEKPRSSMCSSSQQSDSFSTPDTSQSLRGLKLTVETPSSAALSAYEWRLPASQSPLSDSASLVTHSTFPTSSGASGPELYSSSLVSSYFPPLDGRQRSESSSNINTLDQQGIGSFDQPNDHLDKAYNVQSRNSSLSAMLTTTQQRARTASALLPSDMTLLIAREDSQQGRFKGMPTHSATNSPATMQQPPKDQQQTLMPQHEPPKVSRLFMLVG